MCAFVAAILGVVLIPFGARRVRATNLLLHFNDSSYDASHDVREEAMMFPTPRGEVRARIYAPAQHDGPALAHAPGLVLVHGVHDKGIDEPRLARFARAIASSGVLVMTPVIRELADYRVEATSLDTVEAAAHALSARTGHARVGLMGMSFGGGLALVAASRPSLADHVAFVVAVGAHDDLERVTRFFVTGVTTGPDGAPATVKPHDYGPMVLAYSHTRDLFPEADRVLAEEALGLWLREHPVDAREKAKLLPDASRARVELLFEGRFGELREELLHIIAARKHEMEDVSPSHHLAAVHAPVYLLHGAGDTVIPATETKWLARDTPAPYLREALVSRAIVHVDMDGKTPVYEQWQLVDFMARILGEADAS